MPKIGPERRAARREQFVIAARQVGGDRGFRSMTVDDVCGRAGLSKGAFYGHFESKKDLLVAVLDSEVAEVDRLLDRLESGPGPYLERIRGFVREMVRRGEDPGEVQFRAELWSQVAGDAVLREHLATAVAKRRQRLAAFAWMGEHETEMVALPANAFGAILVALVDGLLLHSSVDPTGFRWANIRKAVDVIVDSLALRPA